MEQYIKAKPVAFLCKLISYKATIWVGLLYLSIAYPIENWPVITVLAIYELIFSLLSYFVLRSYYKNGKCTGFIQIYGILRFALYCIFLVVQIYIAITLIIQLVGPNHISIQNSDPIFLYFSLTGIISLIILAVLYAFTIFALIRIAQYYYCLYLTFAHIQKEQECDHIKPLKNKKHYLSQRASSVSYIILGILILVALVFSWTIIKGISLTLQETTAISIGLFGYLGYLITSPFVILGYLIFMFIEVRQIRKLALIFEEVHSQDIDEPIEETT